MVKRKSVKAAIAFLLLLCISAVALPLDFFHNHQEEEIHCSDYGQSGTCSHKVHLTTKKSFCFACAIHIDKTFLSSNTDRTESDVPWIRLSLQNEVTAIVIEPLLTLLRGPPGE